jgi:8-oxo-dGTP pyrophosphatase MutT (NUDIX family)
MEEIERALVARFAAPLPGPDALRRFTPRPPRGDWDPSRIPETARPAAALLLLYPHNGYVHLLLTERHSDLPHHPGQISLPGGRVNAGEHFQDAALREAHEEVGVTPGDVRVIGELSTVFVFVSNFAIRPFVGVTDARPSFVISAREVASLIEVRLDDLRDPARLHWGRKTRDGYLIDFPYFDVALRQVWGATAMILGEFVCLLDAAFGAGTVSGRA